MKILSVELGSWSLKAVELEVRFRKLEVVGLHEIPLPLESSDTVVIYTNAYKQLASKLSGEPDKIVTSLPPAQTAIRFLSLPIKQRKKVEQMYRFELEDSIPFRLDDAIIEHYTSKTSEGHSVFAAIAPKRYVQSHIEWLKGIGLDPDWLTFEGMGGVNLCMAYNGESSDEDTSSTGPIALLDIGHLKTTITVIFQNRVELFRSIGWGGAFITQSLSLTGSLSVEEAERFKRQDLNLDADPSSLSPQDREAQQTVVQSFINFLADVNHTFVSYKSQTGSNVSSIRLLGGTSLIAGINPFLEKSLGLPVKSFQLSSALRLPDPVKKDTLQRFIEPIGRAMAVTRKVPVLFNFRQGDLSKETSLASTAAFLKNPSILKLLGYSFGCAVLLGIYFNIASFLAAREEKSATQELNKVFQDTFRSVQPKERLKYTSDSDQLEKFLKSKTNELNQKLKLLAKGRVTAISMIRQVSDAFPAEQKVDVNKMSFDDQSFQLEGVLYNGGFDIITEKLNKISFLKDVKLEDVKEEPAGKRFSYRASVVGR